MPLLANMTEFGKSRLLATAALESLGVNVVIYPVTTLRLAMGAVEEGLRAIADEGTQEALVPRMQTRVRLYELLGYADYAALDADVFNFTLDRRRNAMTATAPEIHKGLAGVVVDRTAVSNVVPETNSLTYRGYAGAGTGGLADVRGGRVPHLARRAAEPVRAGRADALPSVPSGS